MSAQTVKTVAADPVLYLASLMSALLFCCLSLTLRYELGNPATALAMVSPAAIHLTHAAAIDD